MSGLLIGNVIAPSFLLMGNSQGLLIFVTIILLESLTLWLFFNRFVQMKLSLPKVLIVSIVANIVSGIFGFFSPYAAFNLNNITSNFIILFLAYILSVLIEWSVYVSFLKIENTRGRLIRLQSSMIANFCSYIALALYLFFISTYLPQYTRFYRPEMEVIANIGSILKAEQVFYSENSRFTSTFREFKEIYAIIIWQTDSQAEGFYYRYNISGDSMKAEVIVTPKIGTLKYKQLKSYRAIIFAKPELYYGVCMSDNPSNIPPKTPKFRQNEIHCPPESSLFPVAYPVLDKYRNHSNDRKKLDKN